VFINSFCEIVMAYSDFQCEIDKITKNIINYPLEVFFKLEDVLVFTESCFCILCNV
jgi:hypothetical protein